MKKIIIASIIAFSIISCNNQSSNKETENSDKIDSTEKVEQLTQKFKDLYKELDRFKDKNDFEKYGFSQAGPYGKWLEDIKKLKNNPDSKLLLKNGLIVGELEQLGLSYVNSNGKETEITKNLNKNILQAFSEKSVENNEIETTNSDYEKIKKEYQLFGKWKISISTINQSYRYEIYKKGDEFIGIKPSTENTEELEKNGDKFFVKGSKDGEYYIIDSQKNMNLYDNDGNLSSVGYKATKIE